MPKIHISDIRLAREKVSLLGRLLAGFGMESRLTERQAAVARIYGHASWAELKAGRSEGLADLTVVDGDRASWIVREAFGIASAEADCIVSELNMGDLRSRSARFLDRLILAADDDEVSDIELLAERVGVKRYDRRHGLVSARENLSTSDFAAVLSRLEMIAGKQGESFWGATVLGRRVPVCYSVQYGREGFANVSIRLMERMQIPDLADLGISSLPTLLDLLANSSGIILFSGATGSGKTWTTRSCASHMAKNGRKVVTVDEWIEHDIEGVPSYRTDRSADLNFSELEKLAGFIPDVVVIGDGMNVSRARLARDLSAAGVLVLCEIFSPTATRSLDDLVRFGLSVEDVLRHVRGAHHQFFVRRSADDLGSRYARTIVSETISLAEALRTLERDPHPGKLVRQMDNARISALEAI